MFDGLYIALSSKLVLNENTSKTEMQVNKIMDDSLGINRYIKMATLPNEPAFTMKSAYYPNSSKGIPYIPFNFNKNMNESITLVGIARDKVATIYEGERIAGEKKISLVLSISAQGGFYNY